MTKMEIANGTVHKMPRDLRDALLSKREVVNAWQSISPIARNEWICWVVSVKREETRKQHIKRTVIELKEGKKRPCCWIGCIHRNDKPMNASQKYILGKTSKKRS